MARKTRMNNLTTPELLAQVDSDNMRLKNDFLDYLRSIQRSPGTISGYSNDLDIFFVWVLQNAKNKHFTNITKRDIIAYQGWLINSNENSPSRVRRLKAAISSLSNYCENILSDDEPEFQNFRSVVRKIENPALQPVREKTIWEDAELESLLSQLIKRKSFDKACYLALAMFSGRRKSELCRFRVNDFDDSRLVCDGALYKSAPLKTKGKSGGRYIPCYTLAKKFRPYLQMWLSERERLGVKSEWLFPDGNNYAEHIGISTVNSWANTFTRMSGKNFYAHSIRHYFTTSLVKAGIPDSVITEIVGWESADMCKVYTDIDAEDRIGMFFKDGDICVESNGLNAL